MKAVVTRNKNKTYFGSRLCTCPFKGIQMIKLIP